MNRLAVRSLRFCVKVDLVLGDRRHHVFETLQLTLTIIHFFKSVIRDIKVLFFSHRNIKITFLLLVLRKLYITF